MILEIVPREQRRSQLSNVWTALNNLGCNVVIALRKPYAIDTGVRGSISSDFTLSVSNAFNLVQLKSIYYRKLNFHVYMKRLPQVECLFQIQPRFFHFKAIICKNSPLIFFYAKLAMQSTPPDYSLVNKIFLPVSENVMSGEI